MCLFSKGVFVGPQVLKCRPREPQGAIDKGGVASDRCNTMSHLTVDADILHAFCAKRRMWHHVALHVLRVYIDYSVPCV